MAFHIKYLPFSHCGDKQKIVQLKCANYYFLFAKCTYFPKQTGLSDGRGLMTIIWTYYLAKQFGGVKKCDLFLYVIKCITVKQLLYLSLVTIVCYGDCGVFGHVSSGLQMVRMGSPQHCTWRCRWRDEIDSNIIKKLIWWKLKHIVIIKGVMHVHVSIKIYIIVIFPYNSINTWNENEFLVKPPL